jgi:hypothetical protein
VVLHAGPRALLVSATLNTAAGSAAVWDVSAFEAQHAGPEIARWEAGISTGGGVSLMRPRDRSPSALVGRCGQADRIEWAVYDPVADRFHPVDAPETSAPYPSRDIPRPGT